MENNEKPKQPFEFFPLLNFGYGFCKTIADWIGKSMNTKFSNY